MAKSWPEAKTVHFPIESRSGCCAFLRHEAGEPVRWRRRHARRARAMARDGACMTTSPSINPMTILARTPFDRFVSQPRICYLSAFAGIAPAGLSRLRRALQIWLRPWDALTRTAVELRPHPALNEQSHPKRCLPPLHHSFSGRRDSNPRPLEPHSIGSSERTPANTDKYYLIYFHSCTFELVLWAI